MSQPAPTPPPPDRNLFTIPRSSLCAFPQVYEEYGLAELPDLPMPSIIDCGANNGVFTWAALARWPGGKVTAFEPHPETFLRLAANVKDWPVLAVNAALVHPLKEPTIKLYEGLHADTECSTNDDVRWPHVSQDLTTFHEVTAFDAGRLESCDILKVDTEGQEVPILTGYKHLRDVEILLVEAHAVGGDLHGQMKLIGEIAIKAGLQLVDLRGTTMRFVRDPAAMKKIIPQTPGLPGGQAEPAPEGTWVIVETMGGSYRFGRLTEESNEQVAALDPCYEITPTRMLVPIPVPGGGVHVSQIPLDRPYVWGDGVATRVMVASIKEVTRERAGQLLRFQAHPDVG